MTNLQPECLICARQKNSTIVIFENENWIVRHSTETNILGYVLIESKRHFLDFSEATDNETESYGPLLKRVCLALRKLLPAQRIYMITLAEVVPHFHAHVIPRTSQVPKTFRGRGILGYPLVPAADQALVAEFSKRMAKLLNRSMH
jgi:diadenosine tetraphosphate (Ap4A) HIT family hydrolase